MKTLFRNGSVFDADRKCFVQADVMIRDSEIVSVSSFVCPAVDEVKIVDCKDKFIIPGLVDVHTHGRSGTDFNDLTDENAAALLESYARVGTTTVMATLASVPPEGFYRTAEVINKHRNAVPGLATIAGIHLEGRYLNPVKRGAHNPEYLAPLSDPGAEDLLKKMLPLPLHVSAALELDDGSFTELVKRLGGTLGLAHTNATFEEAVRAVERGATSFTHTFNTMPPLHHRAPGAIGASLMCDGAYSEIICDGLHVHPAMVRMLERLKPRDKVVLITDSMEAAGMSDGEYSIAGLPVTVKDGKAVNHEGALAGSTLDLMTALRNYMKFCSLTLEEALPAATSNPAGMVGIDNVCGRIKTGMRADLIVLKDKENADIDSVWAAGKRVVRYNAQAYTRR